MDRAARRRAPGTHAWGRFGSDSSDRVVFKFHKQLPHTPSAVPESPPARRRRRTRPVVVPARAPKKSAREANTKVSAVPRSLRPPRPRGEDQSVD
jgi:hypothetical protein